MHRRKTSLVAQATALSATSQDDKPRDVRLDMPITDKADTLVAHRAPFFLRQRSSTWFIAFTVGWAILVDMSSYSLVVPVVPFRLEALGYSDVSGKTGWLVAAYAAGLIAASPLAVWIGAEYKNRQVPLTLGLLFMAGAVVMFMESKSFALMVVARILQGFSGTVLWTIGLALIVDSVPEERLGSVIGYVMIGHSCGQAIGPPVGGVLYERLGYRAPFAFSLVVIAVDLILRALLIEKPVALRWIRAGRDIPNFEAPGYVVGASPCAAMLPKPDVSTTDSLGASTSTIDKEEPAEEAALPDKKGHHPRLPPHLLGLLHMLKSPRALTGFSVTMLNGIVIGGLMDSGLTLWVKQEYGLNSSGAGLVFLGVVIPTFFGSPLAGWITDKYGTKWPMAAGVALSIPTYPLLLIRGPLPLFIFFLALVGVALSLFMTPVMVDLSMVAADTPEISTAHMFGASNALYSVGALIGPIIAGQMLSALGTSRGWPALCILTAALSALVFPPVLLLVGGRLDWRRLLVHTRVARDVAAGDKLRGIAREPVVEVELDEKAAGGGGKAGTDAR